MDGRVHAVSEQGELIDPSDASSARPLVPKSTETFKDGCIRESNGFSDQLAVLFFDIGDSLFLLGSLSRNIHYVQRTEVPEPLWLDERCFALESWTGWASWDMGVCRNHPNPSFRSSVAQSKQQAVEVSEVNDGNARYLLPYDKSFFRLRLGVLPTSDSRLWSFGYRLFSGDRLVSGEEVGAEVLIPSIGPGDHTLLLYTMDVERARIKNHPY